MKIKIIKPYYVIRPGTPKEKIEGIINVNKTKAERLIKKGIATDVTTDTDKSTSIKKPNSNNLKSEIINYLDKKNIPYDSYKTKSELLELI